MSKRPWSAEKVREMVQGRVCELRAVREDGPASLPSVQLVASKLGECFKGQKRASSKRHSVTEYLLGKTSCKELSRFEVYALLDWLLTDVAAYDLHSAAATEAAACLRASLQEAGQLTFDL